jgi:zinc transport system substrate-binding protein
MSSRRWLLPVALLPVLCTVAACGAAQRADVVASFYPLQFVAERVVGDHLAVRGLTAPGVEPHDLELSPRQRAALDAARVVLYESGVQPSVDSGVEQSDPGHVVDAARVVQLRSFSQHAHDDAAHPSDSPDPHFWLDPTLLAEVARAFADEAGKADPGHAADYQRNGKRLVAELDRLDRDFREGLARCRIRTLVVSHDAFGYLGDRYDLEVVPIAGLSPDAEPSPKRLAELQRIARDKGVTTIFSETLASPKMSETLAHDLGLETAVLNPIEGLADEAGNADYLSLMRENLAAIRKANDCS